MAMKPSLKWKFRTKNETANSGQKFMVWKKTKKNKKKTLKPGCTTCDHARKNQFHCKLCDMEIFFVWNFESEWFCRNTWFGRTKLIELAHEIMALCVLRKLILQTHMRSHPVGLDVWFLIEPFVYFNTSYVRTAKALARLRGCAGSPESSLVAYVISTIISWIIYV